MKNQLLKKIHGKNEKKNFYKFIYIEKKFLV